MPKVGVRSDFVVLRPVNPADAPNSSIFMDSTNANQMSMKSTSGIVIPIGEVSSTNIFIKAKKSGGIFPLNSPLCLKSDGKVYLADADNANSQQIIGHALTESIATNQDVNVLLVGANLTGALTGLGFVTGQDIFMSETAAESGSIFTNDVSTFSGNNDSVIKVGVADCESGAASATAKDLIVLTDVVLTP